MPHRPRSHQLEDLSRRRFASLLPDNWIIRDKASDYGIDAEIEIFDESHNATGCLFFIQIKSKENCNGKFIVSIESKSLNYFQNLDLPTLIVLYDHETSQFFFQWIWEVDQSQSSLKQKTVTIYFDQNRPIDSTTLQDIEKTALIIRKLRNSPHRAPISIYIEKDSCDAQTFFAFRQNVQFICNSHSFFNLFDKAETREMKVCISINLLEDKFCVGIDLPHEKRLCLEYGRSDDTSLKILCSLSAICYKYGLLTHAYEAAKLLPHKKIDVENREVILYCLLSLLPDTSKCISLAMVNGFSEQKSNIEAAFFLHLFFFSAKNKSCFSALKEFLETNIYNATKNGDLGILGMMYYNMANLFHSNGFYREAISSYISAKNSDPDYLNRDYYMRELAGSMFQCQRYAMARKLYGHLLTEKSDSRTRFVYADACLFNGRFLEAQDYFAKCYRKGKLDLLNMETILKLEICRYLIKVFGGQFLRLTSKAQKALHNNYEEQGFSGTDFTKILSDFDPLDCCANFNSALYSIQRNKNEYCIEKFLICALSCTTDFESWVNALYSAWSQREFETFSVILFVGNHYSDGAVLMNFAKMLEDSGVSQDEIKFLYDMVPTN